MKVTVGATWRRLFLESGLGQSPDDPVEAQRFYAALVEAGTEVSSWTKQEVYVLDAWLNDADVTMSYLDANPPAHFDHPQRNALRRNAQRIQRRGVKMKRRINAYNGKLGWRNGQVPAYHAFQGKQRNRTDWPYYPLASMCPGEAVEGVLWPSRLSGHPTVDQYVLYEFYPLGETPTPETAGSLRTRPYRRVLQVVR